MHVQPDLILENLLMSEGAEERLIRGIADEEHFRLLLDGVSCLENAGADIIVVPCNTVHSFLPELRRRSSVPILSIIEETAKECSRIKVRRVGILGTSKTISDQLHQHALQEQGIASLLPLEQEQKQVDTVIRAILSNTLTGRETQILRSIILDLNSRGADAIILGCTDLWKVLPQIESSLPLLDTTTILENATLQVLLEGIKLC